MPAITVGAWTTQNSKKADVTDVRGGIAYGEVKQRLRRWDAGTGACLEGQKKDTLTGPWVPPVGKVKAEIWVWLWSDGNWTFEDNDATAADRAADPTQLIYVVDSRLLIKLKEGGEP